jgi:hypothetical protein
VKSPVCDFVIVKSAEAAVGVGSVAELFPLLAVASFPPETATLFVTLAAAFDATFTINPKVLEPLVAIAVVLEQVMTFEAALQLQLAAFAPLNVTAPLAMVKPAGRVSTTVTVPEVAAVPLLPTVRL